MRARFIAWAALFSACAGNPIEEGRELFNAGRYPEAKAHLERVHGDAYRELDARRRTTYCLYRGLVFGALGDRANAAAWLGLAQQTEEQYPGSLNPDDVVRLKLAGQQYGPLPNTSDPPPGL
jgi:hypothetical protein